MINSVSCGAASSGTAGGACTIAGRARTFPLTETDGTWSQPALVPGLAALATGNFPVSAVRRWSATWCPTIGGYSSGSFQLGFCGPGTDVLIEQDPRDGMLVWVVLLADGRAAAPRARRSGG